MCALVCTNPRALHIFTIRPRSWLLTFFFKTVHLYLRFSFQIFFLVILQRSLHGAFVLPSTTTIRIVLNMVNMAYMGCTSVGVHTFCWSFSKPRLHDFVCFMCGNDRFYNQNFVSWIDMVNQYFMLCIKIHFLIHHIWEHCCSKHNILRIDFLNPPTTVSGALARCSHSFGCWLTL